MDVAPKHSSPLRRTTAYHDLPTLSVPARSSNQPPYRRTRLWLGKHPSAEIYLPPTSPLLPPETYNKSVIDNIETWLSRLPDSNTMDTFQYSEKYASVPSTPMASPPHPPRGLKLASWTLTPRKIALIAAGLLSFFLLNTIISSFSHHGVCRQTSLLVSVFAVTDLGCIASSSFVPDFCRTLQLNFCSQCSFPASRSSPASHPRHD